MNDTTARIKIGIVTLSSAILFVTMVLWIRGFSFQPQREVTINFTFINSLEVRAPVRFAGARVGEVKRIHVLTHNERTLFAKNPPYVQVFVSIDKDIKIPKDTKAMVNTMGFMGEKYLELLPESRSTTYIGDNESIEGIDPTPMDTVLASAQKLADEMHETAKNMNKLTTEMQNRLPVLIGELDKTLKSAQDLTGDVHGMFKASREDLEHLITNGRQITIYMKSLSHILATRPWKIVWGLGGPLPVEPEDLKYTPPPPKESEDSQKKTD